MQLKRQGKINKTTPAGANEQPVPDSETKLDKIKRERQSMRDNPVMDQYKDKISNKLGNKEKLLNKLDGWEDIGGDSEPSLPKVDLDGALNDEVPQDDDLDEEELGMLEAVERALEAKRKQEAAAVNFIPKAKIVDEMEELAKKMEEEQAEKSRQAKDTFVEEVDIQKTTSGIGGAWAKNETTNADTYRPANGGWGYFPRPKDISKAYGGGKRIGAGVQTSFEDERRKQREVEETREKIKRYREKAGIDVQSEKDHAQEIEEALLLGQRAMQRGIYGTAVSALEKVTKWCSTNSKVGGKVFLELVRIKKQIFVFLFPKWSTNTCLSQAMAYEAVGRTNEAIQVYSTLTTSRIEDVKYNAKRLLYGIEAMQFMRDEAKSEAFSRKKSSEAFIDTTGLGNFAQNFDDRYNTAYIDLDRKGGYYRKLTENVVRSIREARQILLAATDSSEVDRAKIVQALRSIDRSFSDALREEIKRNAPKPEPVAMINGVPIVSTDEEISVPGLDSLNIGGIDTVIENIAGVWKLQLMADSKGDGVNYFNKTLAWQEFDVEKMSYKAFGPSGFLSLSQSGAFDIEEEQRILSRKEVEKDGSAKFFTDVYSSKLSGPTAAVNLQQQIMSIDSEMLITRAVVPKIKLSETVKQYFCVWRRSENSYS